MIATFTGSRVGWTKEQEEAVRLVFRILKNEGIKTLLHGLCVGGDERADALAHEEQFQFLTIGYPGVDEKGESPWRSNSCKCDQVMDEEGYLIRNRRMVKRSDVVIATPKGVLQETRGSGTWATIRYARDMGKKVYIIYPSGQVHIYEAKKKG